MSLFLLPAMVFLPILAGLLLLLLKIKHRMRKRAMVTAVLVLELLGAIALYWLDCGAVCIWRITPMLNVSFFVDEVSLLFSSLVCAAWLLVGVYSFSYLDHEAHEDRFFGFFLMLQGVLLGMDFSANLISMYLFYELITLISIPLILHALTRESILAALKFLFYSLAGAFMLLFGVFLLSRYLGTLDFVAGGSLDPARTAGHETLVLAAAFVGVLGCGAKAGLFPLHGWLPSAHPVAPAPASAMLSGVVAKAGLLAAIRVIYYAVGPDILRGTWVQTVWLTLAVVTIFMGSMLAYREKVLKKRLAYSTVSQLSYVLAGLFLLTGTGVAGALLHIIFHAVIKISLFLIAGFIIVKTGFTRVEELRGVGREMPVTMWCFTVSSLALVGIPPASGFVSKWFLALAALEGGPPVFSWLLPLVLIVSALLTAGYLLPVSITALFPGRDWPYTGLNRERDLRMLLPILVLATLALGLGIFSGELAQWASGVAQQIV